MSHHSLFLNLALVAPLHTYLSSRSSPSSSSSSSSSSPSSLSSSRSRTLLYTFSLLILVLSFTSFHSYSSRPKNYFELLEVDRSASSSALKQAYKRASLALHPDKNPSPEAAALFAEVTRAYETLAQTSSRMQYEVYGSSEEGLDVYEKSARNETQLLVDMCMYYVVYAALTYLFLAGPAAEAGRIWAFISLVLLACLEYSMLFTHYDPFLSFLPRLTLREKVQLLHVVYPSFAHACRLLSVSLYVDRDAYVAALLEAVLASHRDLKQAIGEVETALEKKASGGKGAKIAAAAAAGGEGSEGFSEEYNNLPVAEKLKKQQQAVHLLKHAIDESKKKSGGLPSWAIMVGLYVLFNYVLK